MKNLWSRVIAVLLMWTVAGLAAAAVKTNNGITVDTAVPQAQRGVVYSYDIAANNGLTGGTGGAPYTFAIIAGALPDGFTLSSAGVLSGVNCTSTNGNFDFDVTITSSGGTVGTFQGSTGFSINMTAGPGGACTLVLGAITNTATVGTGYSSTVVATGGTSGVFTYSLVGGALPAGLAISSGGAITGTPTAAGTYNFAVKAIDGNGVSGFANYTITVAAAATITIDTTTLNALVAGTAFNQTLATTLSSGTLTNCAVTTGTLPAGLTLSSSCLVSGTPTTAGAYSFTVTATASTGATDTQAYSGSVAAAVAVGPATLPGGTVGAAYSQTVVATGGTGTGYSYAVTAGSLPAGLTLNASTGVISGTPTTAATSNFTVTATDSGGNTGSRAYTVTIAAAPTIAITTPSLNALTVGTAFSQTIGTSLSSGTLSSCVVSSGTIPAGMSLNASTCTVSGTPTTAGPYNFTVTATSSTGAVTSQTFSGTVQAAVAVGPTTLPNGQATQAYSQTVVATGGTGTGYSYAVTAGSLPAGLTLNASTGVISGTPTTAATSNFTVTATDSGGNTGSRAYTVTIAAAPTIAITTPSLNALTVGTAFSQTIGTSTSSGGLASCVVSSGTIPAGMSLDTTTCTVSGTPTTAGPYNFTVTATATTGATTSQTFSGTVQAAVAVGPASLPTPTVSTAYSTSVVATGGTGTGYTYAVTAGSLPAGLSLNPATGAITGTPTASGTSTFTVEATDSAGNKGNRTYTLTTQAAVTVGPATLATPIVGGAYNQTVVAAGGTGTGYTYAVTSGSLPAGLSLNPATGAITGTPTASGTSTFTVEATDSAGNKGNRAYTLTTQAAVAVGPATLPAATNGTAYTTTVVATGGTGTGYTYALTSGALPPGLTLNASTGVISGTPSTVGTYNFTVEATDSAGNKGNRAYALQLNPGAILTVGPATLPAGMVGINYSQTITATGGTGPYTCSVSTGSLPPGLTLNATTCAISGKPTASGSYTFTARVQDKDGNWGTRTYTLLVDARPDPTKDAQVIGQIDGQFAAATRFAQGQVDNVMRHLESQRSDKCGVTNTLAMSPTAQGKTDGSRAEMNSAKETAAKDRASTDPTLADWLCQQDRPITLWVAGSLDRTTEGAQRFHSDALTVGIETQFGQRIIGGIALGAGFGNTKVGTKGTRSTDSAQSGLLYLTADLKNSLALDAIVGYQGVSFDTKRYVTTDGSLASGSRDGNTFVLSLGLHGDMKLENATFTPYVRLDRYSVDLKSYQETGNSPFLLGYASASQSSTMGLAGLRFDYGAQTAGMQVRPMARVEWRHRFSGSYNQAMWYEDLPDTRYNLVGRSASTDALSAGVGLGVKREGLNVQLEVGSSATSLSSFKGTQVSLTLRHDLR